MKLKKTTRDDDPKAFASAENVAAAMTEFAVGKLVEAGFHPVSAASHLVDHLSQLLRSMDRAAANIILNQIAAEKCEPLIQMAATERLIASYEAQCDQIEHEEQGGRIQ